jgi:hypothetical protein
MVTVVAIPGVYALLVVMLGWGLWVMGVDWYEGLRRVDAGGWEAGWRTALFMGGAGVGLVVMGFLLRPFVVRGVERGRALALSPVAEPLLHAFVGMVCDAVGAPRPVRVEVDCRMNASVELGGGPGGRDGVLRLGLPLVAGLTLEQFTGLLAHEVGHLGQTWALRVNRGIREADRWLDAVAGKRSEAALEAWGEEGDSRVHRGVWGVARVGIGLSRGLLGMVVGGGRVVNRRLLGEMERDADRVQVQVVGVEVFEATFRRLCVLAEVRRVLYRGIRDGLLRGEAPPGNLPARIAEEADRVGADTAERWFMAWQEKQGESRKAHASAAVRIERARDTKAGGLFRMAGSAELLFSNFEALARQVTALHYREDWRLRSVGTGPGAGGRDGGGGGGGSGGVG